MEPNRSVTVSAPVLLIGFNRPALTKNVLASIRQAKPKKLYFAVDGPRAGISGDDARVREVQGLQKAIDWSCEVRTLFRGRNLGSARGPKEAIDWVFSTEQHAIILEDDTVPSASFFHFCDELLDLYADDNRVAMIAGTNHTHFQPRSDSYFFSKNKACWGWATWRRAWEGMDFEMTWRETSQRQDVLENMGVTALSRKHWLSALDHIDEGRVTAWDWPWYFSIAAQNQLTIFPRTNLVANIGFGDDATHTFGPPDPAVLCTEELELPLRHPARCLPNRQFDFYFEALKMRSPGLGARFKKKMEKVFGAKKWSR